MGVTTASGTVTTSSTVLWHRAGRLHAWDVAVDLRDGRGEPLDGALPDVGSWCARVDLRVHRDELLRGAVRAMDPAGHWAMVVEPVLDLEIDDLARLAHAHPLYLLDERTGTLVRVPGANATLARTMLRSGWLHPDACLVVSPAVRGLVER